MGDPKPDFKWPVSGTQVIRASESRVWNVISSPGNLEKCHPFCLKNPVIEWPGETSLDEIHYLSGWIFERRFCKWIEGVGYDLEIGRRGGGTSFVSWRIQSIDRNSCALKISVYPHVLQKLPAVIRWLPYTLRVKPLLSSYLDSVLRGFEWYVVKGEKVPSNQFGKHPWFS